MTLRNPVRGLLADSQGFGAMELALALPFLFLLSLGTVDASLLIGTKLDYEQAAQRATDFALAKRPNSSDGTYIQSEAATAAGVTANDVAVTIWLECNGVKQTTFSSVCPTGQVPARFVNVNITKDVETEFDWSGFARIIGVKAFDKAVSVSGDSLVRFQ